MYAKAQGLAAVEELPCAMDQRIYDTLRIHVLRSTNYHYSSIIFRMYLCMYTMHACVYGVSMGIVIYEVRTYSVVAAHKHACLKRT